MPLRLLSFKVVGFTHCTHRYQLLFETEGIFAAILPRVLTTLLGISAPGVGQAYVFAGMAMSSLQRIGPIVYCYFQAAPKFRLFPVQATPHFHKCEKFAARF